MPPAIGQKTLFSCETPAALVPLRARPLPRPRAEAPRDARADALGYAREVAFDIRRGVLPHADGRFAADGVCTTADVAAELRREGRPPLSPK